VSGYETVRSFVARGHGYSLLNQRLHHDLTYAGGRVVPLRLVDDLPGIEVVLVRPEGVRPTRRALAFESVCKRLYGAER
jgi:DNA-binding transcriptional LysR family regulator